MTTTKHTIKPWEDLTITDDYMFKLVMKHPRICQRLIEKILNIKIKHIKYLETEKTLDNSYTGKGIRLDVYVEGDNVIYDIEMQMQHYNDAEFAYRTRYYQSMIDKDVLPSGTKHYTELKNFFLFSCARLQCLIKSGICTHSAMSASKTLKLGWRTELPSFSFVLMAR